MIIKKTHNLLADIVSTTYYTGRLKMQDRKMTHHEKINAWKKQDWKTTDQVA